MRAHLHTLLWAALIAHIALVLVRVPAKVFGERINKVASWRSEGPARFLFRTSGLQGVEAVEELLRDTPPDAVICWRGDSKGAVEFAPGLLWPRLLVAEASVGTSATSFLGRPVARWQGSQRQAVLVVEGAEGKSLRLVPR